MMLQIGMKRLQRGLLRFCLFCQICGQFFFYCAFSIEFFAVFLQGSRNRISSPSLPILTQNHMTIT